jgi:hypothetical protein
LSRKKDSSCRRWAGQAGSLAKKETRRKEAGSPWLLSRSRIAPPLSEVGLGNLAARPVLPWRSSGPVPHATLDTDAKERESRRIGLGFLLPTKYGKNRGCFTLSRHPLRGKGSRFGTIPPTRMLLTRKRRIEKLSSSHPVTAFDNDKGRIFSSGTTIMRYISVDASWESSVLKATPRRVDFAS